MKYFWRGISFPLYVGILIFAGTAAIITKITVISECIDWWDEQVKP